MSTANELAEIGAMLGNPVRASMLSMFFDGRAHAANELAAGAGVTPQTASWHLANLSAAHLIVAEKRGRHRYFRFASPLVPQMLETALAVAAARQQRHKPMTRIDEALRAARTCYDHLAGKLGVGMADALVRRRCLLLSPDGGELTASGVKLLTDFGIDLRAAQQRKRVFCRPCLDWTEHRPHLAGSVGAAIAERCFELRWIQRASNDRAVTITSAGRRGFADFFGATT